MRKYILLFIFFIGCSSQDNLLTGCWESPTYEILQLQQDHIYIHQVNGTVASGTWTLDGTSNELRLIANDIGGIGPYQTIDYISSDRLVLSDKTFMRIECY